MYRNLAPVDKSVWEQIDSRAREVFLSTLTARKAIHVTGPKGSEYVAYNHGELGDVKEQYGMLFACYKVSPLVETRVEFRLNRWELDNAIRGDRNIDFSNLEEAAKKAALFEEYTIYEGLPEGNIRGLTEAAETVLKLGDTASSIRKSIADGVIKIRNAYVSGEMDLIVSQELYAKLWSIESPIPMMKTLKDLIGGKVIESEVMKGAVLVPHNDENLDLVLGEDFSLGYQEHDNVEVTFFIKESFTLQILDEKLIVRFED